jgi:hypothetical protein
MPDLRKAAESYSDYYQQQSGAFCSATVSLINTKELENLARITNQLISGQTFDIASFDRTSVQCLDNYDEQYTFDFLDFIQSYYPTLRTFSIAQKSYLDNQYVGKIDKNLTSNIQKYRYNR